MSARAFTAIAFAAACGHPTTTAPTSPAASLLSSIEAARLAHGEVLFVATERGIGAYTPDLVEIGTVTKTSGRHLRVGSDRALYFFADRALVRVDLSSGREQKLATLPALHHRCFPDEVDPSDRIQDERDFAIDARGGRACFVAQDRNENMMSVAITFEIDLASGAIVQRMTFALDDCLEPGESKQADPPCTPHASESPTISASKRWEVVRDVELGEQGDYIYAAVFVIDREMNTTYAIVGDKLVAFDYEQAKQQRKRPDGACVVPGEATVRWLDRADALVVEGCNNDGGAIIIHPPAIVRALPGRDIANY